MSSQNKSVTFKVGDYVCLTGKEGYIRYIGKRQFQLGVWYGIELVIGKGQNNGSEHGRKYFSSAARKGIFVRIFEIKCKLTYSPPTQNKSKYTKSRYNKSSSPINIKSSKTSSPTITSSSPSLRFKNINKKK
eukprot:288535_1